MFRHPFLNDDESTPREAEVRPQAPVGRLGRKGAAAPPPPPSASMQLRSTSHEQSGPRRAEKRSREKEPLPFLADDDETQDRPLLGRGGAASTAKKNQLKSTTKRSDSRPPQSSEQTLDLLQQSPHPRAPQAARRLVPEGPEHTAIRTAARPNNPAAHRIERMLNADLQVPLLETPAMVLRIVDEPVTATQELPHDERYPMPSPPPLFSLASVSQARATGPATACTGEGKAAWETSMADFFNFIDKRPLRVIEAANSVVVD